MSYGQFLSNVAKSGIAKSDLRVTGSNTAGSVVTAAYLKGSGTLVFTRTPVAGGSTVDIGSAVASGSTYTILTSDRGYVIGARPVTYLPPTAAGIAVPFTVPEAPTIGTATAGNGTIAVPFTAPSDDGGSTITGYKATLDNGSMATGASSPITFTGLINGISHTAVVQALNSIGYGPASAASNSVTPIVDVVVYGATWTGVAAAIAAKKLGSNVMLITPRNDLGGMMISGIQYTDAWGTIKNRASIPKASLTNELYASLATAYGKNQQTFYQANSYSSESKTTLAKINAMMVEYGITCVSNSPLTALTKTGTNITSATFAGVGTVTASVFIDATYTSDLYVMAGGDYIIGSESRATYSETTQKAGFEITGTQFANPIDPYITPGVPSSGLIKFVNSDALGTVGDAVLNKVQMAGFRLSVTNATFASGQKVAFPAPANYVASDYELHRRDALANKQSATLFSQFVNLQGGSIINSTTSTAKQDMNVGNGGLISVDYPNVAENAEYLLASWERRQQIEANALQYTLGYIHFLQTDSSIPAAVKTNLGQYGLNTDDYQSTGYLPPYLYVREGPRAVGTSPVTGNDLSTFNNFSDYIAFSYYAYDAHTRGFYDQPSGGDHVIQEGLTPAGMPPSTTMARIPMKAAWPKATQLTNVLVTWGMNTSRAAYCAIRVEPLMGVFGEGVGIIAHYAHTNGTSVQSVPFSLVRPAQNLYGFYGAGVLAITTDGTTKTDGTVSQSGWSTATGNIYGTTNYLFVTTPTGAQTVTFTPTIATPGNYRIEVKYADGSDIPVRGSMSWVSTIGGVAQTAVVINESFTSTTSGDWQSLGTFAMASGDNVVGTTVNGVNQVNVVAMRFVPA